MSAPLSPEALKQIEEEKLRRSQQLPGQPPVAPSSPPNEATTTADAALLATQQLAQQRQANAMKREQEAAAALSSVEEADRFEANAQQARAIADESEMLGQQQRQQADQLAQVHQQEEAEEEQQLAAAEETAKAAEVNRVINDPATLEQVKPDLAQFMGVNVKEIDDETTKIYQEAQGIFSGQLDLNNDRQVALAKKIEAGEGFDKKERIALSLMTLLPIIVGAATGRMAEGLQAAGQSMQQLGGAAAARQQKEGAADLAERTRLEDRQLGLAQGKLKNLGSFVAAKGGVQDLQLGQQAEGRAQAKEERAVSAGKLAEEKGIQGVQQARLKTDSDRLSLEQKIKDFDEGNLGAKSKITTAQAKASGYAIRMYDSEQNLRDLDSKGWQPVEAGWIPPNRAKTEEAQRFYRSVSDFSSAILRPQSGAVISDTEYATVARDYFPQPGDTPATLADKERSRMLLAAGMRVEAGDAWDEVVAKAGKDAPDILLDLEEEEMSKEEVLAFLSEARAKAKLADPEAVAKRQAQLEKRKAELLKKKGK